MSQADRAERIGRIDDLLREFFSTFLRPRPLRRQELQITLGQLHCLEAIARLGAPRMSELARELKLHPSTVTALVDGLVAHGLVMRHPDPKDRRIVRVTETEEGRTRRERGLQEVRRRVMDMLGSLNDAELVQLQESLERLVRAAQEYMQCPDATRHCKKK